MAALEAFGPRRLQDRLGSLANNHLLAGDRPKAITYYERAITLARAQNPAAAAARWALNLAVAHGDQQSWRLAARYTEEAKRLLAAAGERGTSLQTMWNEARIAEGEQDLDRAERGYLEAIAAGRNRPAFLWDTQGRLANLYQKLGRQAEAGSFFGQALASAELWLGHEVRDARTSAQALLLERLRCVHRDQRGAGCSRPGQDGPGAHQLRGLPRADPGPATGAGAGAVDGLQQRPARNGPGTRREIPISYMLDVGLVLSPG